MVGAVVGVLIVVGLVVWRVVAGQGEASLGAEAPPETSAPATDAPSSSGPVSSVAATEPATTPGTTPVEVDPGTGDDDEGGPDGDPVPVGDLEAGLDCEAFMARGLGYAVAYEYWMVWNKPVNMNPDRNLIPCETVYPPEEVGDHWLAAGSDQPWMSRPRGLSCRGLLAQEAGYREAVAYWFLEGRPAALDSDGDGIPCETYYPYQEVSAFWG